MILTDSMVALGVMGKGRISSTPLLRLARQAMIYIMMYGLVPLYRYIPSELNPADGPSRGLHVGAAPETQAAHADRMKDAEMLPPRAATPDEVVALWRQGRDAAGFAGG